ncbi:MAG: cohesin domain-containing protein, partial [Bacteroidota bacterium]
ANGQSLTDGTALIELCFTVTGSGSTTITFSGSPTPIEVVDGNEDVVTFTSSNSTITINGGPPPSGFTLQLADVNGEPGDNVCMPLQVFNFNNILGMQFSINYDATALTFTGATNATTALPGFTTAGSVGNPSAGNITFTWNDPGANGQNLPNGATLVELCFTINGNANSAVVFSGTPTPIEVVDGNEDIVTVNEDDGMVIIGSVGTPPVSLSVGNTTASVGDRVCLPVTAANFTDVQTMQFSMNYNGSVLSFAGVQSFNSALNGWDASDVTNPSTGNLSIDWSGSPATITNGGTLFEVCFDVNAATTSNVSISGSPTSILLEDSGNNMLAVSTTIGTVTVNPPIMGFGLIIGDAMGMPGDQVCVPLSVTGFDNIAGMQFSINYDPQLLTLDAIQNISTSLPGLTPSGSFGLPITAGGSLTPGVSTVTWNYPSTTGVSIPDNTVLVEYCFTINGSAPPGMTSVTITGNPTPIEIIDGDENVVDETTQDGKITIITNPPGTFDLALSTVEACQGDNFCVDFTATSFTDLTETQFSITYNSSDLTFTNVANINTNVPGLGAGSITHSPGVSTLQWQGTNGVSLAPNSVLFSMCFTKTTDNELTIAVGGSPTPIRITDGNGNPVSFNGALGQVTCDPIQPLDFGQVDIVNLTCAHEPTGSITIVNMVNGTGPYTYQWNPNPNNQTGNSLTGLSASTVSVTVTDTSNGMTASESFSVIAPPLIEITVTNNVPTSCADASTGSLTIAASGGNPIPGSGYTYAWAGPNGPLNNATNTVSGLAAGAYSVSVTDNNSCTQVLSGIQVGVDPNALSVAVNQITDTACEEAATGSIALTVTGGAPNPTFSWAGPSTFTNSATQTGLNDGTYAVTVNDSNGCSSTLSNIVVNANPSPVTATVDQITNILCAGESTGSITVSAANGVAPYSYDWSGPTGVTLNDGVGQTTQSNLPVGTYSVAVTDANSCPQELVNIQVNELAAPIVVNGSVVQIADNSTPGGVNINVTGGSPGFTYAWTGPNGYTSNVEDPADMQAVGQYCVVVTDAFGCSPATSTCFEVYQSLRLTTFNITNTCPGEMTGAIDITVAGGSCPGLTFQWTGPGFSSMDEDIAGLAAGTYNLVVTDCDGNTTNASFDVGTFAPIIVNATVMNMSSTSNGSILLDVSGGSTGTGFMYAWTGPDMFTSANEDISNLQPGTYTVVVTDPAGCTEVVNLDIIPGDIVINAIVTEQVSCVGDTDGCVDLSVGGGLLPYTITITGPANSTNASIDGMLEVCNLPVGTYNFTILDALGTTLSESFEIDEPAPISIDAAVVNDTADPGGSGSITIMATGGTGNLSIAWNQNLPFFSISDLEGGMYTATISDLNNCSVTATYTIGTLDHTQVQVTPVDCPNDTDGAISVFASGGHPEVNYTWTDQNGTVLSPINDLDNQGAGTYILTTVDSTGATLVRSYEITTQSNYAVGVDAGGAVEPDCHDSADGVIALNVTNSGSTSVTDFEWTLNGTTVGTGMTLTNAVIGDYEYIVMDDLGCEVTGTYSLTGPQPIEINEMVNAPGCDDGDDGSIFTTVSGGTAAYQYFWSTGSTQDAVVNLEPGTYSLTLTDANQCQLVRSFELPEQQPLIITVETEAHTDPMNCNGTASAVVLGGTPPYDYNWMNVPANPDQANVTDLCFGTYFLEVTDAN